MNTPIGPAPKSPEQPKVIQSKKESVERSEVSPTPIVDIPTDKLIDTYEKEQEYPIVVEYFGVYPPFYKAKDNIQVEKLDLIDDFVKGQIEKENKSQTVKSYRNILDSIKKKLGIEKDIKPENVVERLSGFIKAFNRIRDIQQKKADKETLALIYKIAKGKDFDSNQLAMLIEEEYLKTTEMWR